MREDRSYLLGAGPVTSTLGAFVLTGAIWPGLMALSGLMFGAVGVLCCGLLVAIPAYRSLAAAARAFGLSLTRRAAFQDALQTVQSGRLAPDWVVRDAAFSSVLAVDEVDRRIYMNGALHALEDITGIEALLIPNPVLMLSLHQAPPALVGTGTQQAARVAYARLLALLGMTETA